MRSGQLVAAASTALLLGVLPLVAAHDHHEASDMGMDMGMSMDSKASHGPSTTSAGDSAPNYLRYAHHGGWMYAHIATMILGWCFVLPISLMLSVARSRYQLPGQILFHIMNGLGVFTGFVYTHSTPDLYKNNSHRPIGWVATSMTAAWTVMSVFVAYNEYRNKKTARSGHAATGQTMAQHSRWHQYSDLPSPRYSRDSGHGTERNSASLGSSRQNSQESIYKREAPESPIDEHDEDEHSEQNGLLGNNRVDRFISSSVRKFSTPSASKAVRFSQIVLEKFLLLLGFVAIASGFVVWGGLFQKREIFSGLAHFIKGGIFFWYGLLTLGRWMGAFGEFGWAWNTRPRQTLVARWKTRIPSAEFTESFVIWAYGASNVFLEHLNAWGQAWTAQDLEHVSITVLFFGGGLLGMMIESPWAKEFMNTNVLVQKEAQEHEVESRTAHFSAASGAADASSSSAAHELWQQPQTYHIPLNPMPGLVIMLLGIMMSSHHQSSMVSTMMHSQWGSLFVGFAMARAATYVILYIKPPSSHFPSRPPTEIVTSFCLVAGGLMFMFSARDSVMAIESNGFDAMAIFTVTMGLSAIILAWEMVCYVIKGWAVRKERAAAGHALA